MNIDLIEMSKKKILNKIEKLKIISDKMPKQRSIKWLELRKTGFGGSEISALLNKSRYMKEIDLIKKKANIITNYVDNLYTQWGITLEAVTHRTMELILDTKIEEFNILEGSIKGQLYSPDGVGVVKLKCQYNINISKYNNKDYFYILFEFKAPFSRIPNDKISKEYMAQMQSGLSVIQDADNGLFVDALYRICSIDDLVINNIYNKFFHYSDAKKKFIPQPKPIALGLMAIYQTKKSKSDFKKFYNLASDNTYEAENDEYKDKNNKNIEYVDNSDLFIDESDDESDSYFKRYKTNFQNDDLFIDSSSDEEDELNVKNIIYDMDFLDIDKKIKLTHNSSENFKSNMIKNNELDFGKENNKIIGRAFNLISKHNTTNLVDCVKYPEILIEYLDPFIVKEYLWRIDFLYNQDIPIPDINNIEHINKSVNKWFIKQLEKFRNKFINTDIEIIGFYTMENV